jgi:hypothetical protein
MRCLQERKQHLSNLMAVLDQCLLAGDHEATACVCSVLLGMQPVWHLSVLCLCHEADSHKFHACVQELRTLGQPEFQDRQLDFAGVHFRTASILNAVTEVLLSQQLPREQVLTALQSGRMQAFTLLLMPTQLQRHLQRLLQHQPTHRGQEQMTNTIALSLLAQVQLMRAPDLRTHLTSPQLRVRLSLCMLSTLQVQR